MGWFDSPGKIEELQLSLGRMKSALEHLERMMEKLPQQGELRAVYPDQREVAVRFIETAQNAARNCERVFKI